MNDDDKLLSAKHDMAIISFRLSDRKFHGGKMKQKKER